MSLGRCHTIDNRLAGPLSFAIRPHADEMSRLGDTLVYKQLIGAHGSLEAKHATSEVSSQDWRYIFGSWRQNLDPPPRDNMIIISVHDLPMAGKNYLSMSNPHSGL